MSGGEWLGNDKQTGEQLANKYKVEFSEAFNILFSIGSHLTNIYALFCVLLEM